ncbi:MAG: hypothetical protein CMJ58_28510 [Planctomycetaceae bacterium]|nr:hypothetical protein [Planctomycetaceae bacterium]
MTQYRLTELANHDLWEIRNRVLEDNGAIVLRRIMMELDDKLKLLSDFPGMGRARSEFTHDPVLFLPFYSWFIVYDPDSQPLQILRFVSARRDIRELF